MPFACLSPQCGQPQWPSREQQARQTPCEHAHGPVASRTHISCRLAAVRRGQSHPCACQPNAGCRLAHSKRVLAFSFQSRWHRALRIFPQLLAENFFSRLQPASRALFAAAPALALPPPCGAPIPLAVRAVVSGGIAGKILLSDGNRCVSRPDSHMILGQIHGNQWPDRR